MLLNSSLETALGNKSNLLFILTAIFMNHVVKENVIKKCTTLPRFLNFTQGKTWILFNFNKWRMQCQKWQKFYNSPCILLKKLHDFQCFFSLNFLFYDHKIKVKLVVYFIKIQPQCFLFLNPSPRMFFSINPLFCICLFVYKGWLSLKIKLI